jgi:hypothetical protein
MPSDKELEVFGPHNITGEEVPRLTYSTWITNDVLPDDLFSYREYNIQEFLESRNCCLKDFKKEDGSNYSKWLDTCCQEANLNPKKILTDLQKEQSLISTKALPSQKRLDRALGYGMTDSGDKPQFYGFTVQNTKAIADAIHDYKKYENKKYQPVKRVDNGLLSIQPLTAFTSVLYEYTPWTGTPESIYATGYFKNTKTLTGKLTQTWIPGWGTHGVYLFWKVWKMYWPEDLDSYYHTSDVEKYTNTNPIKKFLNL